MDRKVSTKVEIQIEPSELNRLKEETDPSNLTATEGSEESSQLELKFEIVSQASTSHSEGGLGDREMKPKIEIKQTKAEETSTATCKTEASLALDSPCPPPDMSNGDHRTKTNASIRKKKPAKTKGKPPNESISEVTDCPTNGGSKRKTDASIRKKKTQNKPLEESPPRTFQCAGCDKRFGSRQVLDAHELTHTGERPHTCVTCGQGFAQASTLAQHRRRHSGARPYSCSHCGKSYRQQNGLTRHMLRHEIDGSSRGEGGGAGYVCDDCGARFNRRDTLVIHLRSHSGIKPFKCPHCDLRVSDRRSIPRHVGRKHKDKIG